MRRWDIRFLTSEILSETATTRTISNPYNPNNPTSDSNIASSASAGGGSLSPIKSPKRPKSPIKSPKRGERGFGRQRAHSDASHNHNNSNSSSSDFKSSSPVSTPGLHFAGSENVSYNNINNSSNVWRPVRYGSECPGVVKCVAMPDGKVITCSEMGEVILWQ